MRKIDLTEDYRWAQHLLFWVGIFLILLNIFKTSSEFEKIDLIYTLFFLPPIMIITYLNLNFFIPRFLRRERYLLYALFFPGLVTAGALFIYFLFDRWIDYLLPEYYFISYYSVPQLMVYTGSVMILTTLLKLSRSWFKLLKLERTTASHQLMALQSQINPHFLLNGLQTIYALSLDKSNRTPEVILRLSEILKYTLYETGHPRIPLEQEIQLITDYVEMYRCRLDSTRADIRLVTEGEPEGLQIAPMIIIPFIENSFKHGLRSGAAGTFVHIRLSVEGHSLAFSVSNNTGEVDPFDPDKRKGIGIENTRQRLDLLYPGRHRLAIGPGEGSYTVTLHLDLGK